MPKYHSFNPDPYGAHAKIVKLVGANKRILEIGCASGYISEKLKENGCSVIGFEIDKESAVLAKRYCEDVIGGDIESVEKIPVEEKYFDGILFADVLEHLKKPLEVLKKLKKYLKDDGAVYISMPNIANWMIRLNLLFGKFEYQEQGILDKTHLRFFNEKSTLELVNNAGLEIIKFDVTPSIPFIPKKIGYGISRLAPNLFAFQFLIVAKKRL